MQQTFGTTIQKNGNRVFIPLPFDPQAVWGEKQRHYVHGTVNGKRIRGRLDSEGGHYFLALGAAWRRECSIAAGDAVRVILEPEGPQQESLAHDIADALAQEPAAAEFFGSLATFYRKGYIKWIEDAKKPETRRARIAQMIESLNTGKKQR